MLEFEWEVNRRYVHLKFDKDSQICNLQLVFSSAYAVVPATMRMRRGGEVVVTISNQQRKNNQYLSQIRIHYNLICYVRGKKICKNSTDKTLHQFIPEWHWSIARSTYVSLLSAVDRGPCIRICFPYRKVSNMRRTKSQNLNASRLIL